MANLKYYKIERDKYPDEYEIHWLTKENAKKLISKLLKTYSLRNILRMYDIRFTGTNCGRAEVELDWKKCYMKLPKEKMCLGLLIHELGHVLDYKKYGKSGHNKKLTKNIDIIHRLVKKRKYVDKYCYRVERVEGCKKPCNCDKCIDSELNCLFKKVKK